MRQHLFIISFSLIYMIGCGPMDLTDPQALTWIQVQGIELSLNTSEVDLDQHQPIYTVGYGYSGTNDWEDLDHLAYIDDGYACQEFPTNSAGIWRITFRHEGDNWALYGEKCLSGEAHPFCHQNQDGSHALCFHSDGTDLFEAAEDDCLHTE